jgi:predicted metal-binding protein
MTQIGIFRCRDNAQKCPLTNCFKSLRQRSQAFAGYDAAELAGVFTLGDQAEDNLALAKIMKSKGAEAIHIVTCAFCRKDQDGWTLGNGFLTDVDETARRIAEATGLPCVKGTAHLPEGYSPQVFEPSAGAS